MYNCHESWHLRELYVAVTVVGKWYFFPTQMLLVFVCNSDRIGQNLLNEVPVKRFILAAFAIYDLNNLNGRLIGSR